MKSRAQAGLKARGMSAVWSPCYTEWIALWNDDYEVTEDEVQQPSFPLAPEGHVTVSVSRPDFKDTLPARSLVIFSSYDLAPKAPGIIAEQE